MLLIFRVILILKNAKQNFSVDPHQLVQNQSMCLYLMACLHFYHLHIPLLLGSFD